MEHYRGETRCRFLADSCSTTQGLNYVSKHDVFQLKLSLFSKW